MSAPSRDLIAPRPHGPLPGRLTSRGVRRFISIGAIVAMLAFGGAAAADEYLLAALESPTPARLGPLDVHRIPTRPAEYAAPRSTSGSTLLAQAVTDTEEADRTPSVAAAGPSGLIEALSALPLPNYVAPPPTQAEGWRRGMGRVRSGRLATNVSALAPGDHAGLSLSRSPRLWWLLDGPTRHSLRVTILDEDSIDPVFRKEIAGPHPAGIASIDLSMYGVELEPGTDYRWYVSIVVDPERPSRNPLSEGALEVIGPDDARRATLDQTAPERHGHALAEMGVWYDAYDFFSGLASDFPETTAIARHRDRLTESVLSGDR